MKLAIAGAGGRMGRTLIDAVLADRELSLAVALDVPGSPALGKELGGGVKVGSDLRALATAEVLIDFTRPEGTLEHLEACVTHAKPIVIGTTGFSEIQKKSILEASRRIPVVMSPNFAVGVNVLFRLAQTAAGALGKDYDVEIVEAHHRHKVDAPSGTATLWRWWKSSPRLCAVIWSAWRPTAGKAIPGKDPLPRSASTRSAVGTSSASTP